jgi:hypothetical protein
MGSVHGGGHGEGHFRLVSRASQPELPDPYRGSGGGGTPMVAPVIVEKVASPMAIAATTAPAVGAGATGAAFDGSSERTDDHP